MSEYTDLFLLYLTKIQLYIIYGVDLSIVFYNYMRMRFFEWLDLTGVKVVDGVRCVYYTYKGSKYLIPCPRVRGPSVRHPLLEEFFRNAPDRMLMFMGPDNDWHGQGNFLEHELKLLDDVNF